MFKKVIFRVDLQTFAEGASAAGEGSAPGGVTTTTSDAGKETPITQVQYGKVDSVEEEGTIAEVEAPESEETTKVEAAEKASFEDLIKGEYKKDFDERVQDILNRRFKDTKKSEEAINKLAPVLQILGSKYGIEASDLSKLDIETLTNTILEDDSYYEQEAMEKGMTVEMLKQVKKMERENAELKRGFEEQQKRDQAERAWQAVLQQAEEVKQIYPSFNVETEMLNEKLADLSQAEWIYRRRLK